MHYVFISYDSSDYEIAKKIENGINHQLKSFYNSKLVEDRKEGDTTFTEKVIQYFKQCNVFIVLLTDNSLSNQFVNQEWGYAKCLKEFDQIQILLHITQFYSNNKRIESKGFISKNMDFIDLHYENNTPQIEGMVSQLINFLQEKERYLRPIFTEKQNKLKRFLTEIDKNINLQIELSSKKQDFREYLAINPSLFRYDYALQIINIGHLFPNKFIEKTEGYIEILKELNIRKNMMVDWAICRGFSHKDNTQDFYRILNKNIKEFELIKQITEQEYEVYTRSI